MEKKVFFSWMIIFQRDVPRPLRKPFLSLKADKRLTWALERFTYISQRQRNKEEFFSKMNALTKRRSGSLFPYFQRELSLLFIICIYAYDLLLVLYRIII